MVKPENCRHKNIHWEDFFKKEKKNKAYCVDCGADKGRSVAPAIQRWYCKKIEQWLIDKEVTEKLIAGGKEHYFFQELAKSLSHINSNLSNVRKFLHDNNVFFNVRSNSFRGDLQGLIKLFSLNNNFFLKLLGEKEYELFHLKSKVQSLKEKVINAYAHFFHEKELLRKLIEVHLEYKKTVEGKTKLRKQRDKIRDELEEIIGEEMMDEIEVILEDCEKLIHWEKELQSQIANNQQLVAGSQQIINHITYNYSGNFKIESGNMFVGKTKSGNNADFSNKLDQLTTIELEAKTEIPPKY